ncbi:C-GCAxxG-C-C family protein [Chloroflexota bacterium]
MVEQLDREELLKQIESVAWECERDVHGCGRCALRTLMQYLNLGDKDDIDMFQKAILALSGGIAQERETCGAILGGIMAIGLAYFPGKIEDATVWDMMAVMQLIRKYYRAVEKEVGHVRCWDIREVGLGRCYDTADPEEYQKFLDAGGHELCAGVAGKAARIAAEFILELRENPATPAPPAGEKGTAS